MNLPISDKLNQVHTVWREIADFDARIQLIYQVFSHGSYLYNSLILRHLAPTQASFIQNSHWRGFLLRAADFIALALHFVQCGLITFFESFAVRPPVNAA